MVLVGGSGMQASFKSRRGAEDKEEETAKILPFLELFLSSSAATSQGSPPHSQPHWKQVWQLAQDRICYVLLTSPTCG